MNITITGAGGRMGQMLVRQLVKTPGARLVGAVEAAGAKTLGRDAGEGAGLEALGVKITDDAAAAIGAAQVVIDFTVPAATVAHAEIAAAKAAAMVIGTTGLSPEQARRIDAAAQRVPIMWAANMALVQTPPQKNSQGEDAA